MWFVPLEVLTSVLVPETRSFPLDREFQLLPDPVTITIVPVFATIGGLIGGMVAWLFDLSDTLETSAEGAVVGAALGALLSMWGLYFPDLLPR
jgi:hypothetical protein